MDCGRVRVGSGRVRLLSAIAGRCRVRVNHIADIVSGPRKVVHVENSELGCIRPCNCHIRQILSIYYQSSQWKELINWMIESI